MNNADYKGTEDRIIITGADAAAYLLPLRDDREPVLTFRSIFLATGLSGFQASMYQIYVVSSISVSVNVETLGPKLGILLMEARVPFKCDTFLGIQTPTIIIIIMWLTLD